MSWHWRCAFGAAQRDGVVEIGELDLDDLDARAGAARAAVVDVQVAARLVGHGGRGVRAAAGRRARRVAGGREPQAADEGRRLRVGDVEDVDALEALADERAAAGLRGRAAGGDRRVPRAHEDVLVDHDVALARGAARVVVDLLRIARVGDVEHPEAVVRALVGVLALEGEIGVDEARARAGGRHDARRVADRRDVGGAFVRAGGVLHRVGGRRLRLELRRDRAALTGALVLVDRRRVQTGPARRVQREEATLGRDRLGSRAWMRLCSRRRERPGGQRDAAREQRTSKTLSQGHTLSSERWSLSVELISYSSGLIERSACRRINVHSGYTNNE